MTPRKGSFDPKGVTAPSLRTAALRRHFSFHSEDAEAPKPWRWWDANQDWECWFPSGCTRHLLPHSVWTQRSASARQRKTRDAGDCLFGAVPAHASLDTPWQSAAAVHSTALSGCWWGFSRQFLNETKVIDHPRVLCTSRLNQALTRRHFNFQFTASYQPGICVFAWVLLLFVCLLLFCFWKRS